MGLAARQHPVEYLAGFVAPALLAAAGGWSALALGQPWPVAAAIGVVALIAGYGVMRIAGAGQPEPQQDFQPVELVAEPAALEELLLETESAVLLLDDPLEPPVPNSRVVQLFARQEPTPGELVDRIEDFLGDTKRGALPIPVADQPPVDASAALHAALANIRASLR